MGMVKLKKGIHIDFAHPVMTLVQFCCNTEIKTLQNGQCTVVCKNNKKNYAKKKVWFYIGCAKILIYKIKNGYG